MRLQARRQWRLAREIRELEEQLIRHGRHTADSLDSSSSEAPSSF